MKKLIALFIVLTLFLSSCGIIIPADSTDDGNVRDDVLTDNTGNVTDDDNDTQPGDDGNGSGDGTGSSDNTGTGDNTGNNGDNGECTDSHTDVNDDGKCDNCSVSVIVLIDLFAINDLHGKIKASDSQPGIGGLTTYLKRVTDENTILLSSGDMWQGSSESNLTYGAYITDWMNELGFVSMTIGNHEYDWNESYISANAALAEFPLLAINVYDKTTGKRAEYATPSVVIERGGVEIGIIGAIGDCYSSISGDVSGNFTFKVGDDLTELVKAESERLRAEGVDFIVYSLHDGYESGTNSKKNVKDSDIAFYYDTELSDGYVDLVFEAHTHQSYILYDSKGVYHLQGGGENKGLSHAEVSINSANGNTKVKTAEVVKSSTYGKLDEDSLIDELLEKYADLIAPADEVLGVNNRYVDDSEVEQIVANLYYEFGLELWGDEYDIVLGGGFIKTRNPYNLYSGTVTYADVYSLLPFDNNLVLCAISGRDLYYKFLTTDNSDYYVCTDGDVQDLIDSINMNKTYYIVTDTYTSTYSYNNCTEVARCTDRIFARDLFAKYIKDGRLN